MPKGKQDGTEDTRTQLEIDAQDRAQQAVQSAEEGGGMHRPSKAYPKKKAVVVKKAAGGLCRGMGAATRGGKYK